jgi:hypothetical protein
MQNLQQGYGQKPRVFVFSNPQSTASAKRSLHSGDFRFWHEAADSGRLLSGRYRGESGRSAGSPIRSKMTHCGRAAVLRSWRPSLLCWKIPGSCGGRTKAFSRANSFFHTLVNGDDPFCLFENFQKPRAWHDHDSGVVADYKITL